MPIADLSRVLAADVEIGDLEGAIDSRGLTGWDYVVAAAVFVGAILLSRVIKVVLNRVLSRSNTDPFIDDLVARIAGYVVIAIGLIYALDSIGVAVGPLLGALGIVGFALAFALQDILENFVAGIMLQARRPFSRGDQICVGETEGTVKMIDSRVVEVLTPAGETVRIPSSQVIKNPIINHTQNGRRRTTLPVGVAYGTDLAQARRALLAGMRDAADVLDSPEPEVWVTEFGDSSINLAVLFWHQPRISDQWRAQNSVALMIDEALRSEGIEIPFPQRVLNLSADLDERVGRLGSS